MSSYKASLAFPSVPPKVNYSIEHSIQNVLSPSVTILHLSIFMRRTMKQLSNNIWIGRAAEVALLHISRKN